ncbi:MAG TPA: tripartite tricarboxylate transporter substrate binding protein [Bordetella sp.]
MTLQRRIALKLTQGLLALAACLAATLAQADYPDHPITFISAYVPGGTNDFLTRFIAQGVGKDLNSSTIVENKPGANGIVGTTFVSRSAPDGYTLLMGNSASHGINPTLYPNLQYDAVKGFQGVSMVASVPIVLVVNAKLPVHNLKELVEYGKSHPGRLSFGSSGTGGAGHLAGEAFILSSGIDMVHVPYKGDAAAVADTMAGQIPACFVALSSATPQLASGMLKVLAVASDKRLAKYPDVPTMDESGYPNMEFAQWFAIVAPAATPRPVIEKLNLSIKRVLESPAARSSFDTQGAEPVYTTPEQTKAFIESEIQRFGSIIHKLNLHAN